MKLLNPLPQRLDTGATATFAGLLAGDGTAAAPSISFASQTNKGFYYRGSNQIGVSIAGTESLIFTSGGGLQGTNSNGVIFTSTGAVSLFAGGTNQNITLTPSGTGGVFVGAFQPALAGYSFGVRPTTNVNFLLTNSGANLYLGALADSGAAYISGIFDFGTSLSIKNSGTETVRFAAGKQLLGTITDSANGILQLATHTTSAGGIGFGADTSLYTETAGRIILAKNTAGDCTYRWAAGGTVYGYLGQSGGNSILGTLSGTLILQTSALTALTLDASQNATFAGRVRTADGTLALPGHSFGNDTASGMYRAGTNTLGFSSGGVLSLTLGGFGEVVCGPAALGTTTTDGFFYLRAMAGAPTGVPTAYTGRVAATYDSTNNKLYIYNGAWKSVTLT